MKHCALTSDLIFVAPNLEMWLVVEKARYLLASRKPESHGQLSVGASQV